MFTRGTLSLNSLRGISDFNETQMPLSTDFVKLFDTQYNSSQIITKLYILLILHNTLKND